MGSGKQSADACPRCDHTSVGMIVWRKGRILLIERKKPPFGFAPPAGHVDSRRSFPAAARAEISEELGLTIRRMKLVIEGRRDNPCRRTDGTWHYWKVYLVSTSGSLKPSISEVKSVFWCDHRDLFALRDRTHDYRQGRLTQKEWEDRPGLEPIWSDFFSELNYFEGNSYDSLVVRHPRQVFS